MKLELDLERIERFAERDEKRNVEFRFYLKSCGLSSKKIDAMVSLADLTRSGFIAGESLLGVAIALLAATGLLAG